MKQAVAIPFRRSQYHVMTTPRGRLRLLLVTLCLSLALPFVAVAQTNVPAPLPPAAEEALNKGIIAAKVPDYLLAIRYFEEARKLAPQAPVVYLNMGLAESKIPGRELRAMAWFGAYLSGYPEAPNAAAVKEQINVLEVRNRSNVSRLIKTVRDAASQLHDNDAQLHSVAELWARAGDMDSAQRAADLIRHSLMKSRALVIVAKAKIEAGELAGAKSTLLAALKSADRIGIEPHIGIASPKNARNSQLAYVAMAQAEGGDLASAQKTFDLIDDVDLKKYHQLDFVKALAKAGTASVPNAPRHLVPGTQSSIQPAISASDWLKKLDDNNKSSDCPLNTEPFMDLAGHLRKTVPPSSFGAHSVFGPLLETAEKIVRGQSVIIQLLKR